MTEMQRGLQQFHEQYKKAARASGTKEEVLEELFRTFCALVKEQIAHPYAFPPYHQAIRKPFDYYQLGLDFVRPLLDFSKSSLAGEENLQKISEAIAKKENVILLANHQT